MTMTDSESMRLAQALISRYDVTEDGGFCRECIGAGELAVFFQVTMEKMQTTPDLTGICTCSGVNFPGTRACQCDKIPSDINPDEEEARAAAQSIHNGHCDTCDRAASHCQCKDITFTPEEDH